jgi:hypothetical protein
MFNFFPNGVGQEDDVPGFRVREDDFVPGFRLNPDSSKPPDGYTRVNDASSNSTPSFWNDLADAADRVGTRANAVVNEAYSVFPAPTMPGVLGRCWMPIHCFDITWRVEC